ncbi:GntR family transcriptional regulator [Microvirga terrestris]|uniref:GntR family transcriptional regulator n=1 Tax=Microvirga terrestris TaxID=2791024 RepID=UPI001FEE00A4|nr:GntR family transcriptional regulator [Microvirga terrestris]
MERPLTETLHPSLLAGDGPLVVQVHRGLRTLILETILLPWQILSEKEVAACLKVSKTPVREAIIRLSEEGLVAVVPKSRTYVAPINLDRFLEGCFVRLQLESGAARRAAAERSLEDVCNLKACLARQEKAIAAEDYTAFRHLDEEFHSLIIEAAKLSGIVQLIETAKVEIDRIRSLKQRLNIRATDRVLAQHRAITAAIADKDPAKAEEAMRTHLGSIETKVWELGENPEFWALFEAINRERPRYRLSA